MGCTEWGTEETSEAVLIAADPATQPPKAEVILGDKLEGLATEIAGVVPSATTH